jgi:hypothetical protein
MLLPSPAASLSKASPFAAAYPSHTKTPSRKYPEDLNQIITQIFLTIHMPVERLLAREVVSPPFFLISKNLIRLVDVL